MKLFEAISAAFLFTLWVFAVLCVFVAAGYGVFYLLDALSPVIGVTLGFIAPLFILIFIATVALFYCSED